MSTFLQIPTKKKIFLHLRIFLKIIPANKELFQQISHGCPQKYHAQHPQMASRDHVALPLAHSPPGCRGRSLEDGPNLL